MRKIIGLTLIFLFSNIALAGDIAKGKAKSGVCAACHAADGNSAIAINPKLAGQSAKYLAKQLHDFQDGKRSDATMAPMAGLLNDEDIENVSAYYASQKIQHMAVENKHIAIAEKLYLGGDSDRDIPACIACHSATGEGMAAAGFPAVGGQHPTYTISTLKAFRSGDRANDANEIMRDVTAKMSDKQIEALAYYLAGLH
ncbi:MAG: cytochrome c4 [Gammaproteobacteria bacterium]|nr:MAG: cytochrome c4 [Gammaproteobacteria bacterium]